jgi:hypothetical protein
MGEYRAVMVGCVGFEVSNGEVDTRKSTSVQRKCLKLVVVLPRPRRRAEPWGVDNLMSLNGYRLPGI